MEKPVKPFFRMGIVHFALADREGLGMIANAKWAGNTTQALA
jgi:hypothetical protein